MAKKRPNLFRIGVGLGFAAAGISKLVALEAQSELFRSWGWSEDDMRIIGAAELGGAVLLLTPGIAKAGAALLTATSVCIALTEFRHKNDRLVTPRLAMLGAAATSAFV